MAHHKQRFISCEICGLRAFRQNSHKRTFMAKFPKDEARCKQWVKVVGKEDLVYVPIEKLHTLKYVCGNHFEEKAFNKKKNRLKRSAIPSKNLKTNALPDEMLMEFPCHIYSEKNEDLLMQDEHNKIESKTSQQPLLPDKNSTLQSLKRKLSPSSAALLDHDYYCSPKKIKMDRTQTKTHKKISGTDLKDTKTNKRLVKKIHSLRRKIKIMREGNIMPRIKSLALKALIKAYIRNQGRKPQGKRWTPLEKALAIAIYKKSPRAYRHLQFLIALPSIRTLQTLLQSIELEPGINVGVMNHLKKKAAKLDEKDKICALLFDEIALKKRLIYNPRTDKIEGFVDLGDNQYRSSEIADHALVFMIQGLHKKLKQPIAHYFVKGTIS